MTTYIITRDGVDQTCVGPFDSERAAREWQTQDCRHHGDCEWTIWELAQPAEAHEHSAKAKLKGATHGQ